MKKIILSLTILLILSKLAYGNEYTSVNWGPYMKELEHKIKSNWIPPKTDKSKRTIVRFTVSKDGRLLNTKIIESSGIPEGDKAAITAIERAFPLPLPNEFIGKSVPIDFTFDYNVISNNSNKITMRSTYKSDNSHNITDNTNNLEEKQKGNDVLKSKYQLYSYKEELKKTIESNWIPPKGHELDYMVYYFKIKKDGSLKNIKTMHPSNFAESNSAAKLAIKNSFPFKPIPVNIDEDFISVEYAFGCQESNYPAYNTKTPIYNQKPDLLLWLKEKSKNKK